MKLKQQAAEAAMKFVRDGMALGLGTGSTTKFFIDAASKEVPRLGTKAPLPVEVAQFAHEAHVPFFKGLGCEPALRKTPEGQTYVTDNGNYIYDLRFANGIEDAARLNDALKRRAG